MPETPVHLNHFCIIYEISTKKETWETGKCKAIVCYRRIAERIWYKRYFIHSTNIDEYLLCAKQHFRKIAIKEYKGVAPLNWHVDRIILSFVLVVSVVAINYLLSQIPPIINHLHGKKFGKWI